MRQEKEVLSEYRAEQILRKYIPIAKSQLVKRISEIKLKLPLVLKIISPDVVHKSEVQGVRIVKTQEELQVQFWALLHRARKEHIKLEGILAQEFVKGQEVLLGIVKDMTFGYMMTLGLGGIFTEVLKDVSMRKCPIRENDAQEMIDELHGREIFYGARDRKLDIAFLKKVLMKISHIPEKEKSILELDINPFMLNEKGGKAVDARIVLSR